MTAFWWPELLTIATSCPSPAAELASTLEPIEGAFTRKDGTPREQGLGIGNYAYSVSERLPAIGRSEGIR